MTARLTEDPPASARPPETTARLEAALAAMPPAYEPRTYLKRTDGGPRFVNRLIAEPSPYLRQHAHNPVDWRPWGDETLAEAQARDLPVFLSVGYATCHWCHVMEEESFDDEEVAAVLNAAFVPVKLDRETRPDLDQIYITATQLQQGHAGWPNSVWLMPDGRPFHTGTYFPKHQFIRTLRAIAGIWREDRASCERVADQLSGAVTGLGRTEGAAGALEAGVQDALSASLAQSYNATHGGFSSSQQFPQESFLLWLLDHWRRTGDGAAMGAATHTLDAIAAGGLHDHAGGGFHRYTVDPNWRTPHFEKMLYNQGQLARAFLAGWEATGRPLWRRAAERCFGYVARDMTAPDGTFFAAEDADSLDAAGEREEGAFYAWTPDQVRAALGEDAGRAIATLGLDRAPTIDAGAVAHLAPGETPDTDWLDPVLDRLCRAREARPRPVRDDKVITGWNGLMIRALAAGAEAFERPDLAVMAARAGEALWAGLWDGTRLDRLAAEGRREAGLVEDYAWLGLGYLALHDATGEAVWLDRAGALAEAAAEAFADGAGRLRMAAGDGPLGPVYETQDGATPAGESSAAELFARLSHRATGARALVHADRARAVVAALAPALARMPAIRPDLLAVHRIVEEGESGYRRSLADGRLRVRLGPNESEGGHRRLTLRLAEGWYMGAADPGGTALAPAAVEGAEVDWPAGEALTPAFAGGAAHRAYRGTLVVTLRPTAQIVTLRAQVCGESVCLAPVEARFRLG